MSKKVLTVLGVICAFAIIIVALLIMGFKGLFDIAKNPGKIVVEHYEEEFNDVKEIYVEIGAADLKVEYGPEYKVVAEKLRNEIEVYVDENGVLHVKEEMKNKRFNSSTVGEITISVPQEEMDKIEVKQGAGTATFDAISAKDAKFEQGAGELGLYNCNFENTLIHGGAGEIKAESSNLKNLTIEAGVGEVGIYNVETDNVEVKSGIGETNLDLNGKKEDYSIKIEKGLGTIKVDGVEQVENMNYTSGDKKVTVKGGMGEINITFTEEK